MNRDPDVLIVGGGPAGASAAFRLASAGIRVRLLERSRFPRDKPCAECLSPQASRILQEMDVLGELEPRGVWLRGMIVRAPNGMIAHGDYAGAHGYRALRDGGLAIRRDLLDVALLRRACEAGAETMEGSRAVDVVRDRAGRVGGVRVLRRDGATIDQHARFVIGADGLRSLVARRLRLARSFAWPRRISLVGHYRRIADMTEYVEMHVERDGFVGIADVGLGVTTVAAVFPIARAPEISGDRAGFLERWLASKPQLRGRFRDAIRDGGVAAIGPFASHARRASVPGALLVGDAADFFDPFTGEGIYAALRGGELAAAALFDALGAPAREDAALAEYDAVRRREFRGKWVVEKLIGAGVSFPPIVNRAVRALAGSKDMADLLVGVTGDFVPASEVLRPAYLARLFLTPVPKTQPAAWR
ncbi:MAG: NAD(P)/FAD-dependent oxidoreductase [Gemmatimonadaceae bacterium]